MEGYCVKCRTKKEIKDAQAITMKNGKPATQGVCPTCGTKMFRIGKGQEYFLTGLKIEIKLVDKNLLFNVTNIEIITQIWQCAQDRALKESGNNLST